MKSIMAKILLWSVLVFSWLVGRSFILNSGARASVLHYVCVVVCMRFLLAAFPLPHQGARGQTPRPELVGFKGGDLELKGYIWKPLGDGPFPPCYGITAVGKTVGAIDGVAPCFVSKEFVFFVPHRRGQGQSPGPYIRQETNRAQSRGERGQLLVDLHEAQFEDQLTGLEYLKNLSIVDKNRVVVIGNSFGGIQTMLAVERGPGYRVAVDSSGAAETWSSFSSLRSRLTEAARKAKMPVFFLQAENDCNLTPNRVLSEEVRKAGQPVEAKVYPAFGFRSTGWSQFLRARHEDLGPGRS